MDEDITIFIEPNWCLAASGAKIAGFGVPSSAPQWRAAARSNEENQSSDTGPHHPGK
jgi:hypothetical protein